MCSQSQGVTEDNPVTPTLPIDHGLVLLDQKLSELFAAEVHRSPGLARDEVQIVFEEDVSTPSDQSSTETLVVVKCGIV